MVAFSRERARTLAQQSLAAIRGLPPGRETILAIKLMEQFAVDEAERLRLAQEALAIARACDSGWWLSKCLIDLGDRAMMRGDYAQARQLIAEAQTIYRTTGNLTVDIQALLLLSEVAQHEGDYSGAQQLAQDGLTLAQDGSYTAAVWWSHFAIAEPALLAGDLHVARIHFQQALDILIELDDRIGIVHAYCCLGRVACVDGDRGELHRCLSAALQQAKALGDRSMLLEVSRALAWVLAELGRPEFALRLLARILEDPDSSVDTKLRAKQLRERLTDTLAPERAAATERIEEPELAIMLGALLAELRPSQQQDPLLEPQPAGEALTERELEVLRLIAEGLSNYDIATRLFVGVSTIKTHINHLYGKLGIKSRTQAIARARALRLL